jgi:hypothetical protein
MATAPLNSPAAPISPPSVPASPPPSLAGEWAKIIIGGIVVAALTAIFTFLATSRLNHRSMVQQQYIAAVQDFTSTGARVDASITELADTVLDGAQITEARKEARQAIAQHVAATLGLAQVVGEGNEKEYMKGLATLRLLVDGTDNKRAALRTSRARFDLMSNRVIVVTEARRRIYD